MNKTMKKILSKFKIKKNVLRIVFVFVCAFSSLSYVFAEDWTYPYSPYPAIDVQNPLAHICIDAVCEPDGSETDSYSYFYKPFYFKTTPRLLDKVSMSYVFTRNTSKTTYGFYTPLEIGAEILPVEGPTRLFSEVSSIKINNVGTIQDFIHPGSDYVGTGGSYLMGIIRVMANSIKNYYAFYSKEDTSYISASPFQQELKRATFVSEDPSIIECDASRCIAKKVGVTHISVTFPNKTLTSSKPFQKAQDIPTLSDTNQGYTYFNIEKYNPVLDRRVNTLTQPYPYWTERHRDYSLPVRYPTVYFPVKVSAPATASSTVTSCSDTTNITSTGATINWTYTDGENKPQTNYQIQIATNSSFNSDTIVQSVAAPSNTDVSNIRSAAITGLNANTTYYARVRSDNGTTWSDYSSCGSGFTTLTNDNSTTTCVCQNRSQVCTTDGVASTMSNSPLCDLKSSCGAVTSGTNTVFTIIPENDIGDITYVHDTMSTKKTDKTPYVYTTPKTTGWQSLSVDLTDEYDGHTSNAKCSIDNTIVGSKTPTINIKKSPSVTLNKNGQCTIYWDIKDMPDGANCLLSGWGINPSYEATGKLSKVISGIPSNKKYTITCSGGGLTPPIVASVICRINPDIKEN